MRHISFETIIKALQEAGVDALYEKLEALFYTEPFAVIDVDGNVVFEPYDSEDIWNYLEALKKKFIEIEEEV
jgi:hypothetical protein